jgi:hypothetical protein
MGQAGKRRKVFPYYTVQTISEKSFCWVDARKEAFDTLDEANDFIGKLLAGRPSRVTIIEGERSRRVLVQSKTRAEDQ